MMVEQGVHLGDERLDPPMFAAIWSLAAGSRQRSATDLAVS
jgi:hypothetical protein